jgi:hypothetical protein
MGSDHVVNTEVQNHLCGTTEIKVQQVGNITKGTSLSYIY